MVTANRTCPRCKAPVGERAVCHACGQALAKEQPAKKREIEIDLENVQVSPQNLEFQSYFGGRVYEETEIEAEVDGAARGAGESKLEIDLERMDAETYPEIPLPVLCRYCKEPMPDGSPQCPHCKAIVG